MRRCGKNGIFMAEISEAYLKLNKILENKTTLCLSEFSSYEYYFCTNKSENQVLSNTFIFLSRFIFIAVCT